jgi:aldehyde:ferredoxin oxidoreductase
MGSKKIKGILFTGNRKRAQADEAVVKEFSKNFMAEFKDHAAANAYRTLSTGIITYGMRPGRWRIRFWVSGYWDHGSHLRFC